MRPALVAILAVCILFGTTRARADDDLEVYRERFRIGYEKYKNSDFSGAIGEWDSIYRELGPKRGYRLAFNLARAYDANNNPTLAAEKFDSYLTEVAARRAAGETQEEVVEKQEGEAKTRLDELTQHLGRIKLVSKRSVAVQIDLGEPRLSGTTVYVAPGDHTVTFSPGANDATKVPVTVQEGQIAEATAPEPVIVETPKSNVEIKPTFTRTLEPPFSPWILYVSAGATIASFALPIALSAHASAIYPGTTSNVTLFNDYQSAKNTAYASWAVPSALAAITGGLTTYYFFGKKEVLVPVTPQVGLNANGVSFGVAGSF